MDVKVRKMLQTHNPPMINGIGGHSMRAIGILTVSVKIGDKEWPIDMVVQPGDEIVGCLLGFDFFAKYGCSLSMKDGSFEIEGERFKLGDENKHDMYARVRVENSVVIPPKTEIVITGVADGKIRQFPGVHCSAEPAYYAKELSQIGLIVGGTLFFNGIKHVPIPLINPTDSPVTIQKGRTIAIALPVSHTTSYDQTQIGKEYPANEPMANSISEPEDESESDDHAPKVVGRILHYLESETDSEYETADEEDPPLASVPVTSRQPGTDTPHRVHAVLDSQPKPVKRTRRKAMVQDLPPHLQTLMVGLADDLTDDQRQQIAGALLDYQDVFSSGPDDMGHTDLVQHQIDTGDTRPIRTPPRRIPIAKQKIETDEIKRMLDRGVIQPSASAWASPVVLVTKKDGTTRFCIDYRRLNDVTRKDAYPLPRIDDTLDALAGSSYFSTLDLYSGYWQVAMDKKDIEKTAFTTRHGLFEWRVMPFGLCSAPATFERLMELVLHGLTWSLCLVYLDDIIVFGKGFKQSLDNLTVVWDRLREANLKLKPSKCFLFRIQVPFLGHVVTRNGICVDPAKTDAVDEWPIPHRVKDVRGFLGLASYYRRYIKNFAAIAAPLVALTRKNIEKNPPWSEECQKAFDELKKALVEPPILSYPSREDGQFYLSTDASNDALGAVLEQDQEDGKGVMRRKVIAYGSKSLSRAQRQYCATHKELLAVITFCEHFKYYLTGRHFVIITDHASLTWLNKFKDPEGMVARWISRLAPFNYTIIHRPGKWHTHADGLSRRQCRPCKRKDCPDCSILTKKPTKVNAKHAISMLEDQDESDNDSQSEDDWLNPIPEEFPFREKNATFLIPTDPKSPETDIQSQEGRNQISPGNPTESDNAQVPTAPQQPPKEQIENTPNMDPWDKDLKIDKDKILTLQNADHGISTIKEMMATSPIRPKWPTVAASSREVKSLWHQWGKLSIKENILYRTPKNITAQTQTEDLQFVTPLALRKTFFEKIHYGPLSAHQGILRTTQLIQMRFYWPLMADDIELWCKQCHACGASKPINARGHVKMCQSVIGAPNERVSVDLMGPFETTDLDNKYICVIQDYFTKWPVAIAIKDKTSQTVADVFMENWVTLYGCPLKFHSDQGGENTSDLMKDVCSLLRIDKTFTTAYMPRSNGMLERSNRSLQALLKCVVNKDRSDWDNHLQSVVCAYRATPHASTGVSPFKMMFGREITMPIELQFDTGNRQTEYKCPTAYAEWLKQSFKMPTIQPENVSNNQQPDRKRVLKRTQGPYNFSVGTGFGDPTPS
jgi:hypothetical protein